jgi:hypothetical protein
MDFILSTLLRSGSSTDDGAQCFLCLNGFAVWFAVADWLNFVLNNTTCYEAREAK